MRVFSSMQTTAGSKVASQCWVAAKRRIRPPGRAGAMAVGVRGVVEPVGCGDGVSAGVEVGGEDFGTGTGSERGEEDADGSLADDEDGFVGFESKITNGFVDGINGFDEGGLLKGDTVGDVDEAAADDPGHD